MVKLQSHVVEKPWGRTDLPPTFENPLAARVGEVWFDGPAGCDLPLLVKYIFTSEKLSVQVHPNDEEARSRGLARGKNECWYILDAQEDSSLGLGLQSAISADDLRLAAVDGSIEHLMNWKPVAAGDFFYVPAGTIHAIGAGITLLEVQQNSDVTYRLYDYGRPRALHLEEGIDVAKRDRYPSSNIRSSAGPVDTVLVDGPFLSLVRAGSTAGIPPCMSSRQRWVMPLTGCAMSNDEIAEPGECLLLDPGAPLIIPESAVVLIAAEGAISEGNSLVS